MRRSRLPSLPSGARVRAAERGYALVALLVGITIMMIAMAAVLPSWRYVMKNEREEELIFRGCQIADAITCYKRKTNNTQPVSIDQLVKQKCLRKAYKDPMMADGKWRLVPLNEPMPVPGQQRPGPQPSPSPSPKPSLSPKTSLGGPQTSIGPFNGVASRSTEKSLRLFVGNDHYNKWVFLPKPNPRWVGKAPTTVMQVPRGAPTPPTTTPKK